MSVLVLSAAAARVVTVSNTTLYDVAAEHLGSAVQWTRIARLNGLLDPWIVGPVTLKLPDYDPNNLADGITGL